uniref:Insulin-like 3 n=2 Tax=Jaculus jaculus TaxID=51337 RepID=A0A8C5KQR0_JACJA
MHPRLPAWALVLLVPVLGAALSFPEARDKLCGHHFVRTLVRVCGGPRWSPQAGQPFLAGDQELLQWLEGRHLLHGMVADGDPVMEPGLQSLPYASVHNRRHRRTVTTNPAHRCCITGCTQQDLLRLCPH